jgi:hypothetical protein
MDLQTGDFFYSINTENASSMSCHGTYTTHSSAACNSDFGAPASDESRFIRIEQGHLAHALSRPNLRDGDCYCLRTNGLCGQTNGVAYLTVARIHCKPEHLAVFLQGYDSSPSSGTDATFNNDVITSNQAECLCDYVCRNRTTLTAGHPNTATLAGVATKGTTAIFIGIWSNAAGGWVDDVTDCLQPPALQFGVLTNNNDDYSVNLSSHGGKLTCVTIRSLPDSATQHLEPVDGGSPQCCSTARLCRYSVTRLPGCNECCQVVDEDCACCQPCSGCSTE